MGNLRNNNIIRIFFEYFPMILLFVSVMNDLDFNDVGIKYFSFNFSYILIFYYTLKRKEALGYVSLFIAGLFNDVIVGLPMGISSLLFLLLCGFASYLRNITLRPNLVKDWFFFLFTLSIINSFSWWNKIINQIMKQIAITLMLFLNFFPVEKMNSKTFHAHETTNQ